MVGAAFRKKCQAIGKKYKLPAFLADPAGVGTGWELRTPPPPLPAVVAIVGAVNAVPPQAFSASWRHRLRFRPTSPRTANSTHKPKYRCV
jgi:hypothetical protein